MQTRRVLLPVSHSVTPLQEDRDHSWRRRGTQGWLEGVGTVIPATKQTLRQSQARATAPCLPATASFSGDSLDSIARCLWFWQTTEPSSRQTTTQQRVAVILCFCFWRSRVQSDPI